MTSFVGYATDRTSGGTVFTNTTAPVAPMPAGIQSGDVAIVCIDFFGTGTTVTLAGYGSQLDNTGTASDHRIVYTKSLTGSETNVAPTMSVATWGTLEVLVLRGLSSATPNNKVSQATSFASGGGNFTNPSLTIGNAADATVYGYPATATGNGSANQPAFTATPGSLSNWSSDATSGSTAGAAQGIGWGTNVSSPGTATVNIPGPTTGSGLAWALDLPASTVPLPLRAARQPRQVPAQPRRYRTAPPPPDQTRPVSELAQRRETWPRGMSRRGRVTAVVPRQLNPPYPFTEIVQRRQAWARGMPRRGRQVSPVPPQLNPPFPFTELRQWRQPRGFWPRRGHGFTPVPAQQAAASAPAWVQQPLRHARLAAAVARRRAPLAVPGTQDAPLPGARHPRTVPASRRGRIVQVPQAQAAVPPPAGRRARPAVPSRRARAVWPPQAQAAVPGWVQPHRSPPRALPLMSRRGRAAWPPAAQEQPVAHRGPLRAVALIRRRVRQLIPWPPAAAPSFTVGVLTASTQSGTNAAGTYAPAGANATSSGVNAATTSP